MLQKTYFIRDEEELNQVLSEVYGLREYAESGSVLAEVYADYLPGNIMEEYLAIIRNRLPDVKLAGISVISSTGMLDSIGVTLSFCFFKTSEARVITYRGDSISEEEMTEDLGNIIDSTGNVKAVITFPVGNAFDYARSLKTLSRGRENVVFFGSSATVRFARTMSEDQTFKELSGEIFTEKEAANRAKYTYSIGDGIVNNGLVAVVISGSELNVHARYILGWRPLGKGMHITSARRMGNEFVCVEKIDGKPAVDMYKKYLNVVPDEYFLDNVCEFPMLIWKNNTIIGRVPYFPGENGELVFSDDVEEGDEVRLSFAHPQELLEKTKLLADEMSEFEADALFLTICYNRYHFLKMDEHKEINSFKRQYNDMSLCYGGYEILRYLDQGGTLNSALIAVGFREGGKENAQDTIEFHPGEKKKGPGDSPTYERLLTFIEESTNELERSKEAAERASRDKTVFLSDMSHEIRTQLNAILGMNEMIIREAESPSVLEYAEDISGAGNALLGIVNNVLDSAKIEAGKMDIIPVEYEVVVLVSDLIGGLKKPAAFRGIDLNIKVDPELPRVLFGDEVRIKQIVNNLLSNAVKYTEKGSVTLEVSGKESEESGCILLSISVADTGTGIEEEELRRLYDTGQGSGEDGETDGKVIGLPITRNLLMVMGSSLEAESEYGKGSRFSFDLLQRVVDPSRIGNFDLAQDKYLQSRKNYRERFTAPNARILVVDDTQMNHNVIKNLLKKTKLQIDTAMSGMECLSLASSIKYDAILMDHRMPEMDGVETFERLRADEKGLNHDTPVIAITANAFTNSRDTYLDMGFANYISKPVNPSVLESTLLLCLPEDKIEMDILGEEEEENNDKSTIPEVIIKSPIIDQNMGMTNCGSAEYFMETIKIYLESAQDNREMIGRYFEEGNIEDYTTKVHALKSSSRIIGGKRLGDLAAVLEKAGNERNMDVIAEKTPELLKLYGELSEVLNEAVTAYYMIDEEDSEDKEEITPDKLKEAYAAIRETAQMFDYDSVSIVMGMLDRYSIPDTEKERFDRLKKAFRDADWDEINNVLG